MTTRTRTTEWLDNRFVNVTGDTMTGNLQMGHTLTMKQSALPAFSNKIELIDSSGTSTIQAGGSELYITGLGGLVTLGSRPNADNTYDLGTTTKRFKDLLLSGNLSDATKTLTVANIKDHIDDTSDPHGTTLTQTTLNVADLTVSGAAAIPFEVYANGANVTGMIHEDAGTHLAILRLRRGTVDWEFINNAYLSIELEDVERLRIDTDGRVGIGGTPTALLDVNSDILRLRTAKTPASAGAAGNAGDICWDADYVYVCVAANTWKRAAIATW